MRQHLGLRMGTFRKTLALFFLEKNHKDMREIVGKAYTDLGRELKEAQERLAKHGYGCFQLWVESMGFKRNKAYDLIRRYDLIVRISDEQKPMLEDLPVSLTYEIAKPSAESTEPKRQRQVAFPFSSIH